MLSHYQACDYFTSTPLVEQVNLDAGSRSGEVGNLDLGVSFTTFFTNELQR